MWKDAQPYSQLRQCKVNSQQINIFYLLNWKKLSVSENVGKCHSTSGESINWYTFCVDVDNICHLSIGNIHQNLTVPIL